VTLPPLARTKQTAVVDGGPTVVWVHGYTMSSQAWYPLWERMPNFAHVGVDLPGHGATPPWPRTATLGDVGSAVADVMREHGASRLVGLSFGSAVALEAALRDAPVDRLVMAAPTINENVSDDVHARDRVMELARGRRAGLTRDRLAAIWMSSPPDIFTGLSRHPAAWRHLAGVIGRHTFDEYLDGSMIGILASVQDDAMLSTVRARTTVIVGSDDMPRFLRNAERLRSGIADCAVHVLPGVGHIPLFEQPDQTVAIMSEFLAA
jgi:pimeloyl-ACP methyl ester carboxylesterase